jgi:ATP-dependent RNA helicase SUPV3L1/SUV3
LRKFGVRFGAFHLYLPQLVKPAPRALAAQLWALRQGGVEEIKGLDEVPHLASSGRTSFVADKDVPKGLYRAAGFRVCGDRAVRVDILERLADLIRPAVSYRPGLTAGDPPAGTADGDGFVVTVNMTSLAGCSGESFASILRSLGYQSESRKGPAITVPLVAKASTEPLRPSTETAGEETPDHAEPDAAVAEAAEAPAEIAAEPVPAAAEETASADAPEPELAAEAVAEPIAEPEPQLIEVWHPHRQHHQKHAGAQKHGGPRNQHNRAQRNAPKGDAVVPAQTPEMAEVGAAAAAQQPGGQEHHQRDDHKRSDRNRNDNRRRQQHGDTPRHDQAAAPQAGQDQAAKPRFDNRRGKSGGKGPQQEDHRQNKPQNTPRPVRERQPDPNSPFAKLLELKARLENNANSK